MTGVAATSCFHKRVSFVELQASPPQRREAAAMVVKIRLQRFGCRNLPFYRIVVADSRAPRDGKFIERVGTYNPIPNKDSIKEITANSERVHYWLSCGAQPTDRVGWIFGKLGLLPPAPVRQSTLTAIPKALRKK